MAGISRLTLYAIAGNDDIIVTYTGPSEKNGKYSGWITLGEEDYCRPLISTPPVFDSAEETKKAMQEVVDFAKKWAEKDLSDPANPLTKLFESEEGEIIKKITAAAKT